MKNLLLLIVGAVVGGVVGYYGFFWIAGQGYYAMVLPGGMIGVGAALGRSKSIVPAILCCIAAIGLGLFVDWKFEPFKDDGSFGFYIHHVAELQPVTMLMIAAGAFVAFWIPFRRMEPRPAAAKS